MIITLNKQDVNCTPAQADAIAKLEKAHGFAAVTEYKPSDDKKSKSWKEGQGPTQTLFNLNVGIKISRLYADQVAAIKDIEFADVDTSKWIPSFGRGQTFDNAKDQFDFCKAALIESKGKTFDKEVNVESLDAHRLGHLHNYLTIHNSIKVNLVNEKNAEGVKRPILAANGLATVENILIPYTNGTTKTLVEGEKKKASVNGSKVLMDKAIEKLLPSNLFIKMVSLKEGRFATVSVSGEKITEAELYAEEAELKTLKA